MKGKPMNHPATTARLLTLNPDGVAPVSGCRCRECGHNAHRDDPEKIWFLQDGAAYCQPCAKELFGQGATS